MKLNFTMSELVYSKVAIKNNISNMPDIDSLDNILELIINVLQPIRVAINKPMIITSGFRSKELNKIIGGNSNSQHLTGSAVDFIVKGVEPENLVNFIVKMGIEFDQLINEYDSWVHVSYNKKRNRKQVLRIKNSA